MIGVITNLPVLPHKLARSMGDALAGQDQAPRVTDTNRRLEHEPSALEDGDQLEQLSNEVWRLNLSKICKGIKGRSLRGSNKVRERGRDAFGHSWEENGRDDHWKRKGVKEIPLPPTVIFKAQHCCSTSGSAALSWQLQIERCKTCCLGKVLQDVWWNISTQLHVQACALYPLCSPAFSKLNFKI